MTTYILMLLLAALFSAGAGKYAVNIDTRTGVKYNRKGKFLIFAVILVLAIPAAFRYGMGTDYWNYAAGFEKYKLTWMERLKEYDEPGIAILTKISSLFYDHYVSMFFTCAFLTISLYVCTISKYSTNFMYAILLYVFIGAWHGSFNGIRQYLAAAVLFAGHRYLFDRKFLKYLLVVLLASLFHITALIMIPLYFVASKRITFKSIFLTFLMIIVVRYSYDYFFEIMSSIKGTNQEEYAYMQQEVNILRVAVAVVPILVIVFLNRLEEHHDKNAQFYYMLVIMNAGLMVATMNSAYLARVCIYTEMFVPLAYSKMTESMDQKTGRIFKLVTLVCYCAYWLYELYARNLIPFKWIFGKI